MPGARTTHLTRPIDQGGSGIGRSITADAGAVEIKGTTNDTHGVFFQNIMDSDTDFTYAIRIESQSKGNAQIGGVNFNPFIWPSCGPHTNVYGTNYETRYKGSATILNAWSSFFQSKTEADFTGSITNLRGLGIATAVYNGPGKPTNVFGMDIENQGSTGITNSYVNKG